jgi:hypothetical protein
MPLYLENPDDAKILIRGLLFSLPGVLVVFLSYLPCTICTQDNCPNEYLICLWIPLAIAILVAIITAGIAKKIDDRNKLGKRRSQTSLKN